MSLLLLIKDYRNYLQRMKKPYTAAQFLNIVADILGQATDWDIRKQIVDALVLLWQQESGTSSRYALAALLSILDHTNPPSPKVSLKVFF